jgi:hypothetical protein
MNTGGSFRTFPIRTWLSWKAGFVRRHPLEVAATIRHTPDGKARGRLAVSVSPVRMQTPSTGSTE